MWVSTHSHPKVAATTIHALENPNEVSTHSHPKVAASRSALSIGLQTCFNTQPPEGGCGSISSSGAGGLPFQHTATRRWLPAITAYYSPPFLFQHTATRRWLLLLSHNHLAWIVFQHTATRRWLHWRFQPISSNQMFQHTATRRWLLGLFHDGLLSILFQHTATRRWLLLT